MKRHLLLEKFLPSQIKRLSFSCVQYFTPGGWHASTENTDKVERYDARKNKWTSVCPMQERRYRPGVSVLNNRIYVMGGEEGWDR